MALVVIITEVTDMEEAVIRAITNTNITNITHMMMAHRWSNLWLTMHNLHQFQSLP